MTSVRVVTGMPSWCRAAVVAFSCESVISVALSRSAWAAVWPFG